MFVEVVRLTDPFLGIRMQINSKVPIIGRPPKVRPELQNGEGVTEDGQT